MFNKIKSSVGKFSEAHGRATLTSIVVAGVVATGYLGWRAAKKYFSKKEEIDAIEDKTEQAKEIAKIVGPAVAVGAVTAGAAIANQIISTKKINDLTEKLGTAVAVGTAAKKGYETAKEYADKLEGEMDPDKVKEVKKEFLKDKINEDFDDKGEPMRAICNTGRGNQMFKLGWNGKYFRSSKNFVDKVFNDSDYKLRNDLSYGFDELEIDLGLDIDEGDREWIWLSDKGDRIQPDYTLVDDSKFNESVYVIGFETKPRCRTELRSW